MISAIASSDRPLTELPDADRLRRQLVQALKELIKLGLVADDTFNGRSRVLKDIQRRAGVAVLVLNRIVEGEHVTGTTEFAVIAVAIAEPELVLRANTLTVGLMTLTESVAVTDMAAVVFFRDLHPLAGSMAYSSLKISGRSLGFASSAL